MRSTVLVFIAALGVAAAGAAAAQSPTPPPGGPPGPGPLGAGPPGGGGAIGGGPGGPGRGAMEIPEKFTNLKVLSKKISKEDLMETMRTMSRSLGVRCNHCHQMEPKKDWAADTDTKKVAREMMKMSAKISKDLFTWKEAPKATCFMCHRGAQKPEYNPPPMPEGGWHGPPGGPPPGGPPPGGPGGAPPAMPPGGTPEQPPQH